LVLIDAPVVSARLGRVTHPWSARPGSPRRFVIVQMLVAGIVAGAASAPAADPVVSRQDAANRAPACRYADVLTAWRTRSQFRVTVLDTRFRLPSSYRPPLRSARAAGFSGAFSVRPEVIPDLRALRVAARRRGLPIAIRSAYRSYRTQGAVFGSWVRRGGLQNALRTSARPGHSEHQLGTAIDFTLPGRGAPWAYRDWGLTSTGAWLARNAWRYGFVLSYPRGQFSKSCYSYEPWHFRWVGRALAARIHASGEVPRVWLWRNGAAYVNPTPRPTPMPVETPTPTPVEMPTPTPAAEPTAAPPTPEPTPVATASPTPESATPGPTSPGSASPVAPA
jgi:zinc D-Ala-D-Ala carboxypeptidase